MQAREGEGDRHFRAYPPVKGAVMIAVPGTQEYEGLPN